MDNREENLIWLSFYTIRVQGLKKDRDSDLLPVVIPNREAFGKNRN